MNKAFIKEAEATDSAKCPRCGSLGVAVGEETLAAHLPPDVRGEVARTAFFCPYPLCEVVYFDAFERSVIADRLNERIYPKDPDAPMCACFGFTADDIEQDLEEGGVRRVRELLAKAKGPEARCRVAAPSGQCCAGEVQRYYMRRRAASN